MDGWKLVGTVSVGAARVMGRALLATVAAGALMGACARAQTPEPDGQAGREPVVGLPCEGCGAVFVGLPESLEARARIAR